MIKRRIEYCSLTCILLWTALSLHGDSRADVFRKQFEQMDTNQDGYVTAEERSAYWKKIFERTDKNGDGFIDKSEVPGRGQWGADTDGDGRISAAEDAAMRHNQFKMIDKNNDGRITLSEIFEVVGITTEVMVDEPESTGDFGRMNQKIDALGTLTEAPAVYRDDARLGEVSGQIPIYFDALDYRGAPTKVFGWLGIPEGVSKPMPGVVLVHGGGGTAFHGWVQRWNERGYAALSIAVEGQTDIRDPENKKWEQHEWAGPTRDGIYGDSDEPMEDQWMYHAVANTILANSLLRSFPEVDADRVGIMGISWGGVITSTVMGIDDRFAFAIPVYGCGGLDETENQYGRSLSNNEVYKQAWDPNLRLPRAQMPSLWFSWPGEPHFPLDRFSKSADLASGPALLTLVPGMGHGHGSGWNRPESYAFADSVVQSGEPWCVVIKTN